METDYRLYEFKIVHGDHSSVQKWLNQWRHQFELQILETKFYDDIQFVTILLARRPL